MMERTMYNHVEPHDIRQRTPEADDAAWLAGIYGDHGGEIVFRRHLA